MRDIVFIGESRIKHYFVDYIDSILANCSYASIIWFDKYDEIIALNLNDKIIIHIQKLFTQKLQDNNIHVIFNTESVRVNYCLINGLNMYPNIDVIDHSIANITDIIKRKPLSCIHHVPYQINTNEILNVTKTKNIIMQSINNNRRNIHARPIANKLSEYLKHPISFISGWGEVRDLNTFNHKILVSINSYDNMSQISCFRTDRCVFNKMIVIQEIPDDDIEHPDLFVHPELRDMMIFEKLSNIYERTIDVYENYDKYYHQLFGNVDFDKLGNKLRSKMHFAFESINTRHNIIQLD